MAQPLPFGLGGQLYLIVSRIVRKRGPAVPGSIMYVEAGLGYWFDQLQADLDVLIFWNQR